jgi:hypothetical protein
MNPKIALIKVELSEAGQREAIKGGLKSDLWQEYIGEITSMDDVDLFNADADGQLAAEMPGPPLDQPVEGFDAALQVLRNRKEYIEAFLKRQQRAVGPPPTMF